VRIARSVSFITVISPKRHRPHAVLVAQAFRPVKAQDQASDFRGADIQNGDDTALHRCLAHVPHGAL
jgi:hypothetical protein